MGWPSGEGTFVDIEGGVEDCLDHGEASKIHIHVPQRQLSTSNDHIAVKRKSPCVPVLYRVKPAGRKG